MLGNGPPFEGDMTMPATSATALNGLTATEIVAAIRAGKTTCEAVTRACLERIAERDAQVQAWQYVDPDQAIAEARRGCEMGESGGSVRRARQLDPPIL